jgi:hypothetical protein
MSDGDHCRHCTRGKNGLGHPLCNQVGDHFFHNRSGYTTSGEYWWVDNWSPCMACAEAEQIAGAIARVRDSPQLRRDMVSQAAVDLCRKIALGIVQA